MLAMQNMIVNRKYLDTQNREHELALACQHLCCKCRHFFDASEINKNLCQHSLSSKHNLIDSNYYLTCEDMRYSLTICGFEGKLWEAKDVNR